MNLESIKDEIDRQKINHNTSTMIVFLGGFIAKSWNSPWTHRESFLTEHFKDGALALEGMCNTVSKYHRYRVLV